MIAQHNNFGDGKRIVVSGASGLIGRALVASLRQSGFEVVRLVRRSVQQPDEIEWNPGGTRQDSGGLSAAISGSIAVVNLNGASIGKLPWTRGYREQLRESRLLATRELATALRELGPEAPHFVSASAVGFYGHRPHESLNEMSGPGSTFLAKLCEEWETEALTAGPYARVSLLRTAPVLHAQGVLKPLIKLTRLGLGGPLGGGEQIWPWITLDDTVNAIEHAIVHEVTGPINLVAPEAASANQIGRALARQLHRPYWIPAPAWALRLGLGRDAADSLLLNDARVSPDALLHSGFVFTHPNVAGAIAAGLDG